MRPPVPARLARNGYVQRFVSALIRNRRLFVDRRALGEKEYLNVGCGRRMADHCINLDFYWRPGVDLCWDVTRPLPIRDGTLAGVFSEHCLEHLDLEDADFAIGELYRVLAPGGRLRLVVPDGEIYLSRYTDRIRGADVELPYADRDRYRGEYAPVLSVNRIFRSHGHRFIFDFDLLSKMLVKHGFVDVERAAFGRGADRTLVNDTERRAHESLYVEARKVS